MRGGAIIPNTPSGLLKQIVGDDVARMFRGT